MRTRADVLADLEVAKRRKVNNWASSVGRTAEINQLTNELHELEKDERFIQQINAVQTLQLNGYEITVTVRRIQQ